MKTTDEIIMDIIDYVMIIGIGAGWVGLCLLPWVAMVGITTWIFS